MANGDDSQQVATVDQPASNYIPLTEYQPDQSSGAQVQDTTAQTQPASNFIPLTEWDPNAPPPPPPPQQPSGALGAGVREFIHGIPGMAGAVAGGEYGAGVGTAVAPFLGPFAPLAPLGGALIGGVAGGYLGEKGSDIAQKAVGYDDDLLRTANIQAHPWATLAGQTIPALGAFGPGKVAPLVRGASALIGGGLEAGQELAGGQDLTDPRNLASIGIGAAIGGALPRTRFGQYPRSLGRDPAAQRAAAGQLFEAAAREKANPPPPAAEFPAWTGEQYKPAPAAPAPIGTYEPLPWSPQPWSPHEGGYRAPNEPGASWTPSTSEAPQPWSPGAWSPNDPRAAHSAQPAAPAGEPRAPRPPRDLPLGGGHAEAQAAQPGSNWQSRNYGVDVPHGTPGANGVAGTAQEMPPPSGGGRFAAGHGPEDYGKTTQPAAANQVASIDPTIGAVLQDANRTRAAEPPPQPVPEPAARAPEPPAAAAPAAPTPPRPVAPTPPAAPAVPVTLARQQDGSYVLFRGDEALSEHPDRGAALREQARLAKQEAPPTVGDRIKAANPERMRAIGARPAAGAPERAAARRAEPAPIGAEEAERYRPAAAPEPLPRGAPEPPRAAAARQPATPARASETPAAQPVRGPLAREVAPAAPAAEFTRLTGMTPVGSTTLREALAKLDLSDFPAAARGLAGAMRTILSRLVGDIPVHFAPHEEFVRSGRERVNGLQISDPSTGHRTIGIQIGLSPQDSIRVLLHEGIHAATADTIERNRNARLAIRRLMQELWLKLSPEASRAMGNVLTSEHEFTAHAFSHPVLQEVLSHIEASPKLVQDLKKLGFDISGDKPVNSLWDSFIGLVRKMLGVPQKAQSLLEAVSRIGQDVFVSPPEQPPGRRFVLHSEKQPDLTGLPDRELAARGRDPAATATEQNAIIAELQRRQAAQLGYGRTAPPSGPATTGRQGTPPPGVPPGGAAPPTPPPAGGAAHPGAPAPPFVNRATAADQQKGLIATLQRVLYPRGETGFTGKKIQRAAMGAWQTVKDAAIARLTSDIFKTANRMDRDRWGRIDPSMPQFRAFMKDFESGNIGKMRPEWQPMANAMRKSYQDVENFLKGLPEFAQMQFVTDYANHMWAGNKQNTIDAMLSKFGTSSGSLKKRTLPTYEDGFQAGLKPASPNPVEHLIRYLDAIGVPVQQAQIMRDLETGNWIHWAKPDVIGASGVPMPVVRGGPPLGYDKLNVPWAVRADGASAYVPRDMAYTFHNQYNSTLRSGAYAPLFNAVQKIKNISTAVELGLSLYHLNTATTETLGLGIARAGRELGALRPDRALKEFLSAFAQTKEAPLALIPGGKKFSYGQYLLDVQKGLKTGTPDEMRAFAALRNANLHLTSMISKGEYELTRLPDYFDAYVRGSLMNDIQDRLSAIKTAGTWGESAKLAVAAPFEEMARIAQTVSKPIFQYAVPRMKMVAMMKDMQQFMFHNPHATDEQLNTAAARIMDHVDNILGEANRDNLGMNRSLQDWGYLLLRSFAWTILGPGRGIVGGALSGIKGAVKGQNRLSPASPHYDPRVGYSLAFPFVIGSIGSLYNYAMTGQWPWETGDWHDYVMPRTGGTTMQGQPERLKIPGYQKDFIGYATEPGVEIPAKVAGIWRSIWEEMNNNEYPGQPIVPPNASPEEQLYYRGRHMLGASLPIGVKQQFDVPNPDTQVPLAARIAGFQTPGRAYTDPSFVEGQERRAERAWERKARQRDYPDRFARGGIVRGYQDGGPVDDGGDTSSNTPADSIPDDDTRTSHAGSSPDDTSAPEDDSNIEVLTGPADQTQPPAAPYKPPTCNPPEPTDLADPRNPKNFNPDDLTTYPPYGYEPVPDPRTDPGLSWQERAANLRPGSLANQAGPGHIGQAAFRAEVGVRTETPEQKAMRTAQVPADVHDVDSGNVLRGMTQQSRPSMAGWNEMLRTSPQSAMIEDARPPVQFGPDPFHNLNTGGHARGGPVTGYR